jgi:very-short-patch-repair endonuclease
MKENNPKYFARELRKNQTEAEKKLWRFLRSRGLRGFKFRRQQPLDPYVADFCSFEAKLIIELDGGQHAESREKDERRTRFLEQKGFQVIRFWDNEVFESMEGVAEIILKSLGTIPPHPSPLPQRARGRGERR